MFLQTVENLTSSPILSKVHVADIAVTVIVAFCVALITWLFARRKNNSETEKNESETTLNESEIIHNYIQTVGDLQAQINSWLTKVKELRVEVSTVDDLNTELRKAIHDIREEERKIIEELHLTYKHERQRLLQTVEKLITLVQPVVDAVAVEPSLNDLRRESIKILEMLYQLRDSLEKEPVRS